MNENNYIPCISIAPTHLTSFYQTTEKNTKRRSEHLFDITSVDNRDTFSKNSQKKLRQYISWFAEQSKYKIAINQRKKIRKFYKLSLLTLTLPYSQHYSDETIKKELLNQFLTEARQKWGLNNYIWRAEKQQNGNIHFHILIDIFISWKEIRTTWNRICDKLDLIKLWSAKMKEKYELGFNATQEEIKRFGIYTLKKRYKEGKKNNWTNPNSVDIHSLYKIKNVAGYITKYLSKNNENDKNSKVSGRNWYVSKSIKKYCKNLIVEVSSNIDDELKKIIDITKDSISHNEFFDVFKISLTDIIKKTNFLKEKILNHIKEIYNNLNEEIT